MQKKSSVIIPYRLSVFVTLMFFLFCPITVFSGVNPTHIVSLSGKKIFYSELATADFNNDGYKEIVAGGSDGMLYVISTADGSNWDTVWERQCNIDILTAVAAAPLPSPYPFKPPEVVIYPIASKPTNFIEAPVAIADLDNDGHLEIIVAMGGDIHKEDWNKRGNGGILVYRYVTDSTWSFQLSGDWPQPKIDRVGEHPGFGYPDGLWDGILTAPAIGDLDGDGDLEIVVAGIDRRIYAWHHTGKAVAGWPIYRYDAAGNDVGDPLTRGGLSSPALGDLDRDGKLEVVVATMSPPWDRSQPVSSTNPDYHYATLWAFNGDSTYVPGFPIKTEQWFHSSPALGDIDKDGYLEIVIGSGSGMPNGGRQNIVSAYNHDGSSLPHWPIETQGVMPGSPTLADIDQDGYLEVIAGCGSKYSQIDCGNGNAKLYAWNADGSSVPGFPAEPESASPWDEGRSYSMPFSPIVADYNGDGALEILISQTGSWGITIVGDDGSTRETREFSVLKHALFSSPIIEDIDNDGKFEIVAGAGDDSHGKIFIWDEMGSSNSSSPWPMSRQNAYRMGTPVANKNLFLYIPSVSEGVPPMAPVYKLLLDH
ncbi:MAG: VCBS repeat-containing protein [Thermodesulfobacteriota bacterium]|nr:VCBS repeat-containing protein [Thermodesulfobacteriota bacterium]